MSDNNKNNSASKAIVSSTLGDMVFLLVAGFILKAIWNVSVRRMFPLMPYMYFLDGVGVLITIYILGKTASIAFMQETLTALGLLTEIADGELQKFGNSQQKDE
jgi:hypothetical protein